MITGLRPLSTSEILDRTFHLYRNHFWTFVGIAAIPQLLILPLTLGGAALAMRRNYLWSPLLTMAGYLLFYVVIFLSQAPTVVAVSNLLTQKPAGIGSSFKGAGKSLLRVCWIVFLLYLASGTILGGGGTLIALIIGAIAAVSNAAVTAAAALALTVPALYFVLRWMLGWALIIPATVLEGGGFLSSMRRSLHLSKGSRWRLFVIYFLMGIFGFVVALLVEFLLMLATAFLRIRDPRMMSGVFQAVWAICIFVSTSLVGALATIALSLVYYDQRVRKEAFDLQLMMATLESPKANSISISTSG
jgi:hypothetical protein